MKLSIGLGIVIIGAALDIAFTTNMGFASHLFSFAGGIIGGALMTSQFLP